MSRHLTDQIKQELKNHEMEEIPAGEKIRAFMMRHKDRKQYGRMQSTLFLFTPEGIVIMGDYCPGGPRNQGSISDFGYGLDWFTSSLDGDYLCSKFLHKVWQQKAAGRSLRYEIRDLRAGEYDYHFEKAAWKTWEKRPGLTKDQESFIAREVRRLRNERTRKFIELIHDLEDRNYVESAEQFGHAMAEIIPGYDYCDMPGYDYPERDAELLCGLQQRFAELYAEMFPKKEAVATNG